MGCGISKEKVKESENQDWSKQQVSAGKIVNNVASRNSDCNEVITIKKPNNVEINKSNKDSEGNVTISLQESLEVLVTKRDKPRMSQGKRQPTKSQRHKSKELNQVVAWGKKTSSTEINFLEDLRTQRKMKENTQFYEQEYEMIEVDETARFIDGSGQDSCSLMDDSSEVGISEYGSSHQMIKRNREGGPEESFDVSKIIDVEKFRAANVGEKTTYKDNSKDVGVDWNTKSSGESRILNRSHQDLKEEGLNNLYNEDDQHLIESIEKEFLLSQDNFLPGQIVN